MIPGTGTERRVALVVGGAAGILLGRLLPVPLVVLLFGWVIGGIIYGAIMSRIEP
jgi:hypothetical protein